MRRSRRAVRHAGTVGGDDANLVSTHPAPAAGPSPGDAASATRRSCPAAAASGGPPGDQLDPAGEPVIATRSADDSDVGWGDRETGSNDDRLHQDKPPHW